MSEYFNKKKSLTFLCLYLKDGEKKYYSSRLREDAVSKEEGMKGLRKRFVNGKFKGKFKKAVIFDNGSKKILEKFDENGKPILTETSHENDPL